MATTNIAKNQLQEIFQKAGQQLPQYDVDREVNGTFRASVTVRWEGREMMAYGTGPRKKAAEMDAAENMLRKIMSPVTSPVRNIMPRTPPTSCSPPRDTVGPRTPPSSPPRDAVGPWTPPGTPPHIASPLCGGIPASSPPNMAKNDLQQLLQKNGYPVPQYPLVAQQGASHTPRFTIKCVVSNNMEEVVAEEIANASSKKDAEKQAAQQMLPRIEALLKLGPLTPDRHGVRRRTPPAEVVDPEMDGDIERLLTPYRPCFECKLGVSGCLCLVSTTQGCTLPVAAHGMGDNESQARRDAAVHLMDNLVAMDYKVYV